MVEVLLFHAADRLLRNLHEISKSVPEPKTLTRVDMNFKQSRRFNRLSAPRIVACVLYAEKPEWLTPQDRADYGLMTAVEKTHCWASTKNRVWGPTSWCTTQFGIETAPEVTNESFN